MNVFVSYRHLDLDFALRLVDALRRWDYTPWIDCAHISPGGDWIETINQGLQLADAIVGVLSDKSIESKMVLREWLYALENRIPLILVRLRPCTTPYPFNSIQYIDCSTNETTGFAQLEKALKSPKPEDFERLLAAKPAPAKTIESAKQRVTNRAAMLQKVHDFWIKGVLEPAKLGDVGLDLPAEQRPEAVQPEVRRGLYNPDFDSFSLGSGAKIVDVFRRMGNELLILGAPGSGKTITLLELARDLIVQAQVDDRQPIPVVLNLSSWAEKHPDKLEDWLTERLFLDYGVPRRVGTSWIENGILLFLFDGLDEVLEMYRDACVIALNTFWRTYDQVDNGIAVCSRIADYEKLNASLHLENAILLDALTPAQADEYLANLGPGWDKLRAAIPGDAVLRQFAESPLLLNMMTVAYQDIPREQIEGLNESDQKRQLFDRYVIRRLREAEASGKYPSMKTQHFLGWLAKKMVAHQQILFQIEELQSDWLDTERQHQQYRQTVRWFPGLLYGLALGLVGGLVCGLALGLVGGLVGGILFVRYGGLGEDSIHSVDRLNWSWRMAREGLIEGAVGGLVFSLIYWLSARLRGELRGELIACFVIWLVFGLVCGLVIGIFKGLKSNSVEQRMHPNQGIYQSARNWLIGGLVWGLIGGLIGGLVGARGGELRAGLVGGLLFGLVGGLFGGLPYGEEAVIKHVVLRYVLICAGVVPLNYAEFLDYCAARQLLRRVGGGYIFRHRMLMEYFAERESETAT